MEEKKEIRIRNMKKVEHILGAIQDGDHVRPAEAIPAGGVSDALTPVMMKAYDTPMLATMVESGELDIEVNGKSTKPAKKVKPAPVSVSSQATEADATVEARTVAEILASGAEPTEPEPVK